MTKVWEKLESKSSYHFPNSWWFRGQIVLNTWHLRKLWRAHEDQIKPRTSELFESETLEQFNSQFSACLATKSYLGEWAGVYLITYKLKAIFGFMIRLKLWAAAAQSQQFGSFKLNFKLMENENLIFSCTFIFG